MCAYSSSVRQIKNISESVPLGLGGGRTKEEIAAGGGEGGRNVLDPPPFAPPYTHVLSIT